MIQPFHFPTILVIFTYNPFTAVSKAPASGSPGGGDGGAGGGAGAGANITKEQLTEMLLQSITDRTGYKREELHMNQRLLDDLNMDSIKVRLCICIYGMHTCAHSKAAREGIGHRRQTTTLRSIRVDIYMSCQSKCK